MFAVIRSGGKQYRVSVGDVVTLEKLDVDPGNSVDFADVLMVESPSGLKIGKPVVKGAVVRGDVLAQERAAKVISFKRRRRKASSKRTIGHRQHLTRVRITDIAAAPAKATGSRKTSAKAADSADAAATKAAPADSTTTDTPDPEEKG